MKKKYSLFLSIILIISLLAVSAGTARADSAQAQKLSIVTTIFPEYDWVMNILGDQAAVAEVTMLLDNGVDLHSYQPTVDDIIKISTCDVFIYVGGESDEWVDSALAEAINRDMIVINLLEVLGDRAKEEEIVEGMEAEHEHDEDHDENHEHEHDEDHEHEEEAEYDEHVWLSLKNAVALCSVIADALGQADPAHAEEYQANTAAYTEMLSELDAQFEAAVEAAAVKTVLFGDRFPFRYLTDDYNLHYYAAFVGCSAETEASFATIVFLANKADELELSAICQIESSNGSIPRTIKENTHSKNQEILTFDSMQSTTSRDVANGASYLGIMEQNLETLKLALQ
jgi:zinc transport system substrate-binding protein